MGYEVCDHEHIASLQVEIHKTAVQHGFWEASDNIGEKLALVHSEISEALEEYRMSGANNHVRHDGEKPEGFATELADAVIRIMDLAEYCNIDLESVIRHKMDYNATRPHMHGKRV